MTAADRREVPRRKYRRLGSGELAAAAVFLFLALTRPGDAAWSAAHWAALIPLLVILVQAGSYWLLASQWVGRGAMPGRLAALYRGFRVLDVVVLLAGLAGVLVWLPDPPFQVGFVLLVWAFAVVEYLNYFVVRLSYPARVWLTKVGQWRTPQLVLDLTHQHPDQQT